MPPCYGLPYPEQIAEQLKRHSVIRGTLVLEQQVDERFWSCPQPHPVQEIRKVLSEFCVHKRTLNKLRIGQVKDSGHAARKVIGQKISRDLRPREYFFEEAVMWVWKLASGCVGQGRLRLLRHGIAYLITGGRINEGMTSRGRGSAVLLVRGKVCNEDAG